MQIGVVFLHAEMGNDPDVTRAYAQTSERLGFAHLNVYDCVLGLLAG